jgi:hypothetical protein
MLPLSVFVEFSHNSAPHGEFEVDPSLFAELLQSLLPNRPQLPIPLHQQKATHFVHAHPFVASGLGGLFQTVKAFNFLRVCDTRSSISSSQQREPSANRIS